MSKSWQVLWGGGYEKDRLPILGPGVQEEELRAHGLQVGSWVRGLGRLGSLLLRLLRPGRLWRCPDYGHLLMVPLYPGES